MSHSHGHEHGHVHFASEADADRLEVEAAGLLDDTHAALDHIARVAGVVSRVVDVGCGPGVVTCELAERFVEASVVGVDSSPVMLARVASRASRSGLSGRVSTAEADLGHDLAHVGPADVVWASMVVHHLDDVGAALANLASVARPGGTLAIVERSTTELAPVDDLTVVGDHALPSGRRLWLARRAS